MSSIWMERNDKTYIGEVDEGLGLLSAMIKNRGIEDVEEFLNPDEDSFIDPYLMKGMDETVTRLQFAMAHKEKIVIFGDYDVDGVSSTSILFRYFEEIGYEVGVYIPDRRKEGYGLNEEAIVHLKDLGYDLIITVDCGISAIKEVDLCNQLKMDIIITDHHQCPEQLPKAYAILNPHQSDCSYPFKELCGAGIALKLVQALKNSSITELMSYLEIAAVATIADLVPLLGENRSIVKFGLNSINQNKLNLGIQVLIDVAQLKKQQITSYNVGFQLAPRINAGGRLDSAMTGVLLLTTHSVDEAMRYAVILNEYNAQRQLIEQTMLEEAITMIESHEKHRNNNVIVVYEKGWNEGVIGIVSSRITERYGKPSFVFSIDENGIAKGSGRSISDFHLFHALQEISDCMLGFGGHSQAAGLSIRVENLDIFEQNINFVSEKYLTNQSFKKKFFFDSELKEEYLNLDFLNKVKQMEPFGIKNPTPLFLMKNVRIKQVGWIGKNQTHFRGQLNRYTILGFDFGELSDDILANSDKELDILCSIEENVYRDAVSLQLKLRDYKWIEQDDMIEDMIPLAECIIEEILKEESFFKNIAVWKKRDFDSNTLFLTSIPSILKQLKREQLYLDCATNQVKFISNIEKIFLKDYNNIIICDSLSKCIISHQNNLNFEKIYFFNFLSNPLKISKVFSFPQGKNISFLEKIERNQKIKISADIIENMALDRVLKMWIQILLLQKLEMVSFRYSSGNIFLEDLFIKNRKEDYLKILKKLESFLEVEY